ncbi:MAG: hypothetical protein LH617_08365 [Ramlibacter sp.]|nr:hypothetical protein [Ramlibacter sp.]
MNKYTTATGVGYGNLRLLRDLIPSRPIALFKSFREADLAAAAAERVVVSATANAYRAGVCATPEQILLAASLRETADKLFKLTMVEWGKLNDCR